MSRHAVMAHLVSPLLPFDLESCPPLEGSAEFIWKESGILEISYGFRCKTINTNLDIVLPGNAESPQRRHKLYETTCFEAFLALPRQKNYWELNVSPSGHWNLYTFDDYRSALSEVSEVEAPIISFYSWERGFRCDVSMNLLPWWPGGQPPEVSITTVLEHPDSCLSYWAIRHAAKAVDFHDRSGFISP